MVKLCTTCAHHNKRESGVDECLHPDHLRPPSIIDGKPQPTFCESMRMDASKCGREAILWTAK